MNQIGFVHFVEHCNVFEQLNLMPFQSIADFIYIDFYFVIVCLEGRDFIGAFFEETKNAFTFLVDGKASQLHNQVGEHAAHFAQIFGANVFESRLGKVGDFLLCRCAILQHGGLVIDFDFFRKRFHGL